MSKNFEQYDFTRRIQDAVGSTWTVEWIPSTRTNPVHNGIVAGDMFWTWRQYSDVTITEYYI